MLLGWAMEPIVQLIFDWQTRKRFARLRDFLAMHAHEVVMWQQQRDAMTTGGSY